MVNKDLDENKTVIVQMNKRLYHYIVGELVLKGMYKEDMFKIVGEEEREKK